jgi:hypothetical protein
MTMESSRQFIVDHVPDEDAFANSRRGQQTSVGRPAAPINFVGVTLEGFEHISIIAQVPDLKLSIKKIVIQRLVLSWDWKTVTMFQFNRKDLVMFSLNRLRIRYY